MKLFKTTQPLSCNRKYCIWNVSTGNRYRVLWIWVDSSRPTAGHGPGCFLRPLPSQLQLCFDNHNYIFVTKLETH